MEAMPSLLDTSMDGDAVPMYSKNGRALSAAERATIAKRRGQCVRCGVKTHTKGSLLRRQPVTDDNVYNGTCIRCQPDAVPPHILEEWDLRNKPAPVVQMVRPPPKNAVPKPTRGSAGIPRTSSSGLANGDSSVRSLASTSAASQHGSSTASMNSSGELRGSGMRSTSATHLGSSSKSVNDGSTKSLHRSMPPNAVPAPLNRGQNRHMQSESSGMSGEFNASSSSLNYRADRSQELQQPSHNVNSSRSLRSMLSTKDLAPISEDELLQELESNRMDGMKLQETLLKMTNSLETVSVVNELKEAVDPYRHNASVMVVAAGAMWRVSVQGDRSKSDIIDTGLLDLLMDSLRAHPDDQDLAEWSLGTMASLALHDKNKILLAQVGAIEVVIETLEKHQKRPGVLEWACRALYNLVYSFAGENVDIDADIEGEIQKNIATVEEAGGIPIIVDAMKMHANEAGAQVWAMRLLWRLQERDDETGAKRTRKKIGENDFLGFSIKIMRARSTSQELFHLTSRLIYTMLLSGNDKPSDFETVAKCLPSVVRVMKDEDDDMVLESGCRLLATMSTAGDRIRHALKEAGAIPAVIAALVKLPGNSAVVEWGSWCLWKLSVDKSLFDAALVKDAMRALATVNDTHEATKVLLMSTCGFIANAVLMTGSPGSSSDIPIVIPIFALEEKSDDEAMGDIAVRALSNICASCPDMVGDVVNELNMNRIVKVFQDSADHTTRRLCTVLIAMAAASEAARKTLLMSGILAAVSPILKDATDKELLCTLLDLVAALVATEVAEAVDLPTDIVEKISNLMSSDNAEIYIQRRACSTLRNVLMVSAKSVDNDTRLVDCMVRFGEAAYEDVDSQTEVCASLWAFIAKNPVRDGVMLTKMFKAVVSMTENHCIEDVDYEEELFWASAGALSAISECMTLTPIHVEDAEIDVVISAVYKIVENDSKAQETLANLLTVLHNLCRIAEDAMIQSGVIVVIIDIMAEREDDEQIQVNGCSVLSMLSSSGNLQVNLTIVQTDGIEMLGHAITNFAASPKVNEDALAAFGHLSGDEESRVLIIAQGGLHLAVSAMSTHEGHDSVVESACSALAALTVGSDPEAEELLAEAGAIDAVLATMKSDKATATLQEKCMLVLQNIAKGTSSGKRVIGEVGGINCVVAAADDYLDTPNLLERAFSTIRELASLPENQGRIVEAKAVSLVINGMLASIEYEGVQKHGCECFTSFAEHSEIQALVKSSGGAETVSFAMRAHYSSELVLATAFKCLAALAGVDGKCQGIASDEIINGISSGMRRFPKCDDIQVNGCEALAKMSVSAEDLVVIQRSADDVKIALNKASSRHPGRCSSNANVVLGRL